MRKKSLLIILSIISISLFAQNNSNFNGLSISTGTYIQMGRILELHCKNN